MHFSLNLRSSKQNDAQKKHTLFTYDSYTYEIKNSDLVITFQFTLHPEIVFHPTLTLKNIDIARFSSISKVTIDNLVFNIGLIESISYWKAAAPRTIHILCGFLDEEQKKWWRYLIVNGMGEYAYKNSIDLAFLESIQIEATGDSTGKSAYDGSQSQKVLIPIGGGKDSAVSSEILKKAGGITTNALLLNPTPASRAITSQAGFQNPVIIERRLDPLLLELNAKGYLNGHTPFSACLGFISVLCAVLFDYSDIVLANERSANQGNMTYQGRQINHQYSKSFDFEKRFSAYTKKYLATNVSYFSFLRPLYEIQIAKVFSDFENYFPVFKSCNVGQKENKWCGTCAKCLFVYVMLFPFIDKEKVEAIFGEDLLKRTSLLPITKDLLGQTKVKPFDCVGTYEEVRAAFFLGLKRKEAGQVLLDYFEKEVLPKYPTIANDTENILHDWDDSNLLPESYKDILSMYKP